MPVQEAGKDGTLVAERRGRLALVIAPRRRIVLRGNGGHGGQHALRYRHFRCPYRGDVPAERIDVATAREMWRAGDTVIDVRTPEEYARGHIAGAVNVPIDTLPGAIRRLGTGPVVTACTYGGRARRAAELLALAGRTAFAITGGTAAWRAAGLPVHVGTEPGRPRRFPR